MTKLLKACVLSLTKEDFHEVHPYTSICNCELTGQRGPKRNLCGPAISLLLVTAFVGSLFGCSHRASDKAIVKNIPDKISADPDTKGAQVSVAAKDGKITLTGNVKSPANSKKLSRLLAKNLEPGELTTGPRYFANSNSPRLRRLSSQLERFS